MPELITTIVELVFVALLSGGGVFFVTRYVNKVRKKDAEDEAKAIVERAIQDAENYRRETELALKEASMKQKEELEREQQREKEFEREKQITAKPAKRT